MGGLGFHAIKFFQQDSRQPLQGLIIAADLVIAAPLVLSFPIVIAADPDCAVRR
jgi:hypothetical protein